MDRKGAGGVLKILRLMRFIGKKVCSSRLNRVVKTMTSSYFLLPNLQYEQHYYLFYGLLLGLRDMTLTRNIGESADPPDSGLGLAVRV